MKHLQKPVLCLLLLLLLLFPFVSTSSVSAQVTPVPIPTGTWYRPSLEQFRDKVVNSPDDELFAERYVFAQINWIIHSLTILFEFDVSDPSILDAIRDTLSQKPSVNSLADYARLGPSGFLVFTMGEMLGSPPASGIDSVKSTLAKFSIAAPAHAQAGYGYNHLTAIQGLWSAARNTAYLVIALLLVVAGFMIILRTKINPQTIVTIQLIIPRLITALILVTFSYAIAGLVIDLVYVLVALFLSALATTNVVGNFPDALAFFANPGYYKIFITFLAYWIVYTLDPGNILQLLPSIVGLIMIVVVFFLLLRIWWMMMKTYITLLLLIIIGPWQIMLGVLPGQSGFTSWFKNIIAQASVFVVVPIMFVVSMIFTFGQSGFSIFHLLLSLQTWITQNFVIGNLNGAGNNPSSLLPSFPIFSSPSNDFFRFISAFAILALMPKIADMVRDAIKAPKFPYGSAFGEALSTPVGFFGGVAGMVANEYRGQSRPEVEAPWRSIADSLDRASKSLKGGV
jgi:hypothetical protein